MMEPYIHPLLAAHDIIHPTELGSDAWKQPEVLDDCTEGEGDKATETEGLEASCWPGRLELPGGKAEQLQIICRLCSLNYTWTNEADYRDFAGKCEANLSKLPR